MPLPRPILIVEDDATLRATLAERITLDGEFTADEAASAQEAEQKLAGLGARYDAILLDIGLPDADGCDLCAKLRRNGLRMPIIMLTGADTEADVVRGLDAGANDYIPKPFRLPELLARVRAQLRAFDVSGDAVCNIGPYLFYPSAKLLTETRWNRKIQLTNKENAVLRFLHRAGGKTVSGKVLLSEVWGYHSATATHTLESHIYRLRQKIEPNPRLPELVLAESGGYRLVPTPPLSARQPDSLSSMAGGRH